MKQTIIYLITFLLITISSTQAEETKILINKRNPTILQPNINDPFLWDPFREMDLYRSRMYQMLNNLHTNFSDSESFYNPQLSMEEGENSYIVKVDLPGLDKDSINIEVENKLLKISGHRNIVKENKNDQGFYHSERSFGAFSRSITLPEGADEDKIDANYENGVLKIKLPLKAESTNTTKKKITISEPSS